MCLPDAVLGATPNGSPQVRE
eukprot:SAG11_NODE_33644_length_276_cov_0.587571_1_plen_20_part_01